MSLSSVRLMSVSSTSSAEQYRVNAKVSVLLYVFPVSNAPQDYLLFFCVMRQYLHFVLPFCSVCILCLIIQLVMTNWVKLMPNRSAVVFCDYSIFFPKHSLKCLLELRDLSGAARFQFVTAERVAWCSVVPMACRS